MALLNNNFDEPLYKQLENIILKKIRNGEYLPGEKLPGSRQLAQTYGINRLTVNKALDNLTTSGFLYKKPSSGTYVRKDLEKASNNINLNFSNSGLRSIIKKQGINLKTEVINKDIFSNIPYFQAKLNLNSNDKIFGIHRLRSINNKPIALEYNYLPLKYFSDIGSINFNYIGLYDYMNSKNHIVEHNDINMTVIKAPKKEAKLMEIKLSTYLFKMQYINSDHENNIVEYTESYLLPNEAILHFNIKHTLKK